MPALGRYSCTVSVRQTSNNPVSRNNLKTNPGDSAPRKAAVLTRFVDTVRDRDREWVMRFGRGLVLAALLSGVLWGALVLILRSFF
jgi:hypothetical protein